MFTRVLKKKRSNNFERVKPTINIGVNSSRIFGAEIQSMEVNILKAIILFTETELR